MRQNPAQFLLPTLELFLGRNPDRYRDSKDIQRGQARTPQPDRKTAHKQPPDSPAEFRLPACRWRLSPSLPPIGQWFLDFLCLEPLHACSGLRPLRQIAAPGMRSPSPSSIEYFQPSAEQRLETLPDSGCWGPKAALPPRPPTLCLANSYCYSSTVEAERPPMDKSKRRESAPEADRGRARSAQRASPALEGQV